jgi:hypothetical protein
MSKQDRTKYQLQYDASAQGLHCLIANRLSRQDENKFKVRDLHTATQLRITVEQLATLQNELNNGGLISCRRGPSRTIYKFVGVEDYG